MFTHLMAHVGEVSFFRSNFFDQLQCAGKIQVYLQFNPGDTVLGLANASMVRLHAGRATLVAGRAWVYRTAVARELKIGQPVPELER